MPGMNIEDTIVAVSSPPGAAPRGIVRLSGPTAVRIADGLFAGPTGCRLAEIATNRYLSGRIRLGPSSLPGAVYLFRGPRSYTRQDVVELHLIGAPAVLGLLVETCLAAGARKAEPGEFTARAFLAGALDITQVHGIAGMIAARSDRQLEAAERLLHGALSARAKQAREELADLLSLVEGALDFADEPIEFITPAELHRQLARLLESLEATSAAGVRAERWGELPRVVFRGPPNVGKSSLLNRLTGLDRVICTPMAGTTRDVISAPLAVGELECLLIDVAGLGDAADELDAQAQQAARRAVQDADLILETMDAVAPVLRQPPSVDEKAPIILVFNKRDLIGEDAQRSVMARLADESAASVCFTSALTGEGCEQLKERIADALRDRPADNCDAPIALVAEHRQSLDRAIAACRRALDLAEAGGDTLGDADLVAAELREAAGALAVLAGQDQTEDLLGRIFARFCVGK